MKFDFEKVKSTFQQFNIYQKAASVVLAVAVPVSIGMGIRAMGRVSEAGNGASMSQLVSSITSIVMPSSSSRPSSSSVSKRDVKVTLKPSSVEEDLEVQIVDEDGQMIVGPQFQLVVKGVKNGYNKTWDVNDGFLRLTKLPSGDYTVGIKEKDGYIMPEEAVEITVEKKVEYKEVDVSDKVVDESEIDVSKEDAAYDDQVSTPSTPAPIKDTVEFVASSQKTEKKDVEVIITKYKPEKILADGTMVNNAGVSSGLYPVYDSEGYLIGAYKLESPAAASQVNVLPVQLLAMRAFALGSSAADSGVMAVDDPSEETILPSESTALPQATPQPTPTPTPAPPATPTPTPAPTPTSTPEPSAEPTPEPTPDATVRPEPSPDSSSSEASSSSQVLSSSQESSSVPDSSSESSTPSSGSSSDRQSSSQRPSSSQAPSSSGSGSSSNSGSSSSSGSSEAEKVKVEVDIFDEEGRPVKDSLGNTLVKLKAVEIKTTEKQDVTTYYGWQTISGAKYYYDKNGEKVTGTQTIQGITYYFDKDGKMGSRIGIDISKYQPTIDWKTVKEAGIEFVIIRAGYRGYGTGKLVEDPYFKQHIRGATAAGLKVGVYVFSQAINTQEAVEEASLALQLVKGYNLAYPIFFDTEYSTSRKDGRADSLSQAQRTTIAKAFCETIQNAGYNAGIYASKTWFYYQLDYSQISQYDIWVAHYASATDFQYRYDIWQYTGTGTCAGIAGAVDLNIGYTAY